MCAPRIEGQRDRWLAVPCQGADRTCRFPIAPKRGPNGESYAVLSGDGDPVTVSPAVVCDLCRARFHVRDGQIEVIDKGRPDLVEAQQRAVYGEDD